MELSINTKVKLFTIKSKSELGFGDLQKEFIDLGRDVACDGCRAVYRCPRRRSRLPWVLPILLYRRA